MFFRLLSVLHTYNDKVEKSDYRGQEISNYNVNIALFVHCGFQLCKFPLVSKK